MQYVNAATKKGQKPKEFMVAYDSVANIVKVITKKKMSLEEAEEKAGISKGCINEAIRENEIIGVKNYHNLVKFLFNS